MTTDLEPGPALDDLVLTQVLGWHKGAGGAIGGTPGYESPSYWYDAQGFLREPCVTDPIANLRACAPSTYIADAWIVQAHLLERGVWIHELSNQWENSWRCILAQRAGQAVNYSQSGLAASGPHALCQAALRAAAERLQEGKP